jgi:hypothetical protein
MAHTGIKAETRGSIAIAATVLHESPSSDPQFRERFDREASDFAADAPHVCTLYDIGEQAVLPLVMEFLEEKRSRIVVSWRV